MCQIAAPRRGAPQRSARGAFGAQARWCRRCSVLPPRSSQVMHQLKSRLMRDHNEVQTMAAPEAVQVAPVLPPRHREPAAGARRAAE